MPFSKVLLLVAHVNVQPEPIHIHTAEVQALYATLIEYGVVLCSTFPQFFLLHRQQLQLTGLISFYLYKKKKNHDLALSNFLELGK